MLEFRELKTATFKEKPTCSQLLYLFTDAISFIDAYSSEHNDNVQRVYCELFSDSLKIHLRIKDFDLLSFPVHWFSCQSYAYCQVRPDSRSNIKIVPYINDPSIIEVEYKLFMDLPF